MREETDTVKLASCWWPQTSILNNHAQYYYRELMHHDHQQQATRNSLLYWWYYAIFAINIIITSLLYSDYYEYVQASSLKEVRAGSPWSRACQNLYARIVLCLVQKKLERGWDPIVSAYLIWFWLVFVDVTQYYGIFCSKRGWDPILSAYLFWFWLVFVDVTQYYGIFCSNI